MAKNKVRDIHQLHPLSGFIFQCLTGHEQLMYTLQAYKNSKEQTIYPCISDTVETIFC